MENSVRRLLFPDRALEGYEDPLYEPQPFLNRRAAEKTLIGHITLGDPALLEEYLTRQLPDMAIGKLSREALSQARYLMVALTALVCRAAIDEGVPEHYAFSLSDRMIQEADRMLQPDQIAALATDMMLRYCRAIRDTRLGGLSPAVRSCCEYMLLKVRGSVSLEELSGVCHLSPHYISDLFRRELGMGALQYFHRRKLLYARQLLLSSPMTVTQIASYLSYPSASNFTQRFRKEYGLSPLRYRKEQSQTAR